jgi:hypothetical protein
MFHRIRERSQRNIVPSLPKQLKHRPVRPKMAGRLAEIVGTVMSLPEDIGGCFQSPTIAKNLACRDTHYRRTKNQIST